MALCKKKKKSLTCSTCQFLLCKISHHGCFQAATSLTPSLQNSWTFLLWMLAAKNSQVSPLQRNVLAGWIIMLSTPYYWISRRLINEWHRDTKGHHPCLKLGTTLMFNLCFWGPHGSRMNPVSSEDHILA